MASTTEAAVPDTPVKTIQREQSASLKPKLSLVNGCTVIIGSIIGSGIFITPGGVLSRSESVGLSLIIWTFCGLISMVGALCYAELGMTITRSGADYAYIMEAFGPFFAFLRLWVEIIVIRPALIAIVSVTFAQYVIRPRFECDQDISIEDLDIPLKLLSAFCILIITFVNCWSIRLTAMIQDLFTYAKVLALVLIIITGGVQLCLGHYQNFLSPWEGIEKTDTTQISLAIYEGLFAYNGWNFLNYVIEELKEPHKNLTKSISISLITCTVIYVLANVAYLTTVSPEDIKSSRQVALMFGKELYGPMWWTMPVFVSLSCFGTVNGILFTSSRLFFVGAREGHMPILLNMVSYNRKTPIPAVVIIGGLSTAVLMLSSDINKLIVYSSFIVWFAVGASVFGLIVLRWTQPDLERPLKIWLGFPILYVVFTMSITLMPIYVKPWEALIGFIILLTGIPVYMFGIVWKSKPRSFTKLITRFTLFCQKLLLVVPEQKKA